MKAQYLCILRSILLIGLFLAFQVPSEAHAGAPGRSDSVLTGELVVTNAARNQFRLVTHSGSFTAPPGISVAALDGKPVEVELGHDGRVSQITQMQVRIEPIEHGFEVVSGELVRPDPASRTFSIAGDGRTYVAPYGVDIGQYAGRMVEMRLDEQGQVMDINLITQSGDMPLPRSSSHPCTFDGASVANGSSICRSGVTFRCTDGAWVRLGTACSY